METIINFILIFILKGHLPLSFVLESEETNFGGPFRAF